MANCQLDSQNTNELVQVQAAMGDKTRGSVRRAARDDVMKVAIHP